MYEKTTNSIRVSVHPVYLEDQSKPEESQFFWAYHVTIENGSSTPVRLVSRRWQITDSRGWSFEVSGRGVVGEQPFLNPGETFEYTSGTPLRAPSGVMIGQYVMMTGNGEQFPVEIPAFSLDSPHEVHTVH